MRTQTPGPQTTGPETMHPAASRRPRVEARRTRAPAPQTAPPPHARPARRGAWATACRRARQTARGEPQCPAPTRRAFSPPERRRAGARALPGRHRNAPGTLRRPVAPPASGYRARRAPTSVARAPAPAFARRTPRDAATVCLKRAAARRSGSRERSPQESAAPCARPVCQPHSAAEAHRRRAVRPGSGKTALRARTRLPLAAEGPARVRRRSAAACARVPGRTSKTAARAVTRARVRMPLRLSAPPASVLRRAGPVIKIAGHRRRRHLTTVASAPAPAAVARLVRRFTTTETEIHSTIVPPVSIRHRLPTRAWLLEPVLAWCARAAEPTGTPAIGLWKATFI